MRICIDARAARNVATGLGTYARQLTRNLARVDRANEYVLLVREGLSETIVDQENFTEIPVPFNMVGGRNALLGSRVINPLAADVYHALFHFVPFGVEAGSVVTTLHDLIWIDHREVAYADWTRRWLKCRIAAPLIRHAVRCADRVIAISQATRSAAVSTLGVPAQRITMIHHGVDPIFFEEPDPGLLPESVRGRRFIFALGNSLPYKNCGRLVRAFALIARDHPDVHLFLVGRGDGYGELHNLAMRAGLSGRVTLSGQLSLEAVRACFGAAQFFAFPSLVEGFGLPILEAMASGCPVLTSDRSAPAEVAASAAQRVDPTDVDAIAAGMRSLVESPARRNRLARFGRARAAQFTWERAAERTLGVYEHTVGRRSRRAVA